MTTDTLQSFNLLLTQRLTAAAIEIFGFVEKTIIDYHEEVQRTKVENQRLQKLLDLVYQPEIRLQRTDCQKLSVPTSTEERSPKKQHGKQDSNPSVGQKYPGQIKEEEEEKEELRARGNEGQPWTEDSDEGDSLTKELIRTVQQLESSTQAQDKCEPNPSSAEDPNASEAKKLNINFYRCHICNHIFTQRDLLQGHLITHQTKGNFDCLICGKHMSCQSMLRTHMKVHTGERPFQCTFCGKGFKKRGHLTDHERTHTGEKPFRCHVCLRSFNRGTTMRNHIFAKHIGKSPYKCLDCDETFTERLLMNKHMQMVHGIGLSVKTSSPP